MMQNWEGSELVKRHRLSFHWSSVSIISVVSVISVISVISIVVTSSVSTLIVVISSVSASVVVIKISVTTLVILSLLLCFKLFNKFVTHFEHFDDSSLYVDSVYLVHRLVLGHVPACLRQSDVHVVVTILECPVDNSAHLELDDDSLAFHCVQKI